LYCAFVDCRKAFDSVMGLCTMDEAVKVTVTFYKLLWICTRISNTVSFPKVKYVICILPVTQGKTIVVFVIKIKTGSVLCLWTSVSPNVPEIERIFAT